jgi:hypothetical protein
VRRSSLGALFLKKKKARRKVGGGVQSSQDIAMLIEDMNPNW